MSYQPETLQINNSYEVALPKTVFITIFTANFFTFLLILEVNILGEIQNILNEI